MTNRKTLLLIFATTFCPLLIAGVLTNEHFSSSLGQKQQGSFLDYEYFLTDEQTKTQKAQWKLIIPNQLNDFDNQYEKLTKIKTALGKRSNQVTIIKLDQDNKLVSDNIYIAAPNGQVLLAYQKELVGKPLYKDLTHLIRSNEK